MKIICVSILFFVTWSLYAQAPKNNYICFSGVGSQLIIESEKITDDNSGCDGITNFSIYGFKKNNSYIWPVITAGKVCNESVPHERGCSSTITGKVAKYTATSSETIAYVRDCATMSAHGKGKNDGDPIECTVHELICSERIKYITITFVPITGWNNFPPYLCQNRGEYDFSSHINTDGVSVSYQLDGKTDHISGTRITGLNTLSAGEHTLKAIKAFDNGSREVTQPFMVYGTPVIGTHPAASIYACPGTTATISVSDLSGSATYTYQWKEGNTNLSPNADYSNTSEPALSVKAGQNLNLRSYSVVVSSGEGCGSTTSNVSVLKVHGQLSVTGPADIQACPNQAVTLSVVATLGNYYSEGNQTNVFYQWQESNNNNTFTDVANGPDGTLGKLSTYTYTTTNTAGAAAKYFKCRVRSFCDSETNAPTQNVSDVATLTVYGQMQITTPPGNASVCPGSSAVFTAGGSGASGNTPHYQWFVSTDGVNYSPQATGDRLALSNVQQSLTGAKYKCSISDGDGTAEGCAKYGNVTSIETIPVTLTVYRQITVNSVTVVPDNYKVCPGGTISYKLNASSANNRDITYKWQYSTDNGSGYTDCGTLYSGSGSNNLIIDLSADRDVRAGYKYQCILTDDCGAGNATQNIYSVQSFQLYTPVSSSQPASVTLCPAGNGNMSVNVTNTTTGRSPYTYKWQSSSSNGVLWFDISDGGSSIYSGSSTAALAFANVTAGYNHNKYRCIISNGCGADFISEQVSINLYSAIPVTTQPNNQAVCPLTNSTFTAKGTAQNGTLHYKWEEGIIPEAGGGIVWRPLTNGFTAGKATYSGVTESTLSLVGVLPSYNNYQYRCVLSDDCGVHTENTTSSALLTLSNNIINVNPPFPATTNACLQGPLDIPISVNGSNTQYQWEEYNGSRYVALANQGTYSGVTTEKLHITSVSADMNGKRFRVKVTCTCGELTTDPTVISLINPPTLLADPTAGTACEKAGFNLRTNFSGTANSYQWEYSESNNTGTFSVLNPGSSSNELSLSNLTIGQTGYYRCVATNICGNINGGSAKVTVNPAVKIDVQPTAMAGCEQSTVTNTVTAGGTGPYGYIWERKKDMEEWESVATTLGLSLSNVKKESNNTTYRVKVTGGCGEPINSNEVTLTVHSIPAAPVVPVVSRCGAGELTATASADGNHPVFRWYANQNDQLPIYTGNAYTVNALTATANYYVSVELNGCLSRDKARAELQYYPLRYVDFGGNLTLCSTQNAHDLTADIKDENVKNGVYSWSYNGTGYNSNNFDPKLFGAGTIVVHYAVPATTKSTPSCYRDTDRNIIIVGDNGNNGITIDAGKAPNKTLSLCVGDAPYNLTGLISPTGGTWTYEGSGNTAGLTNNDMTAFYTPTTENFTETTPNKLRYTVVTSGCNTYDLISIYVKDNKTVPILSGIPEYVCAGQKFKITASVPNTPGVFTYCFIDPSDKNVLNTTNPYELSIDTDTSIGVVSINSFNCKSAPVTAKINTPFGTAGISSDKTVCNVGEAIAYTFSGQSNSVFQWDFGDGTTGTIQNPVKYYYKPGNFTTALNVTSSLGCDKRFSQAVRIIGNEPSIITGTEPNLMTGIYPNPVKDLLVINTAGRDGLTDIMVYNSTGQRFNFIVSNNRIDISELIPGVYIIKIEDQFFKFIKL